MDFSMFIEVEVLIRQKSMKSKLFPQSCICRPLLPNLVSQARKILPVRLSAYPIFHSKVL